MCMVMYDNELKTKENKNWTKDKIETQHIHFTDIFGLDCLLQ